MLDPMLTLLAAKAKAVGLVAGTAMVTTALVGGGAVAMTAVSLEGDVSSETEVVQQVDPAPDVALLTEQESDTDTVGIDPEEPEDKPRPPLPEGFECDESLNHGQNVSGYAKSLPKGPGRGEKVSALAQSDCGKAAGEQEAAEDGAEVQSEEAEVEEPKPAQAEKKAAQAERKADKKAAQTERKAEKKAAKTKD